MKTIFKKTITRIAFSFFSILALTTSAQATIFNWDFGFSGNFLAFDTASGDDFHFGSNATLSTSEIEYDDVAQTLTISIMGTGDVVNSVDSSIIVSGASFNFNADFTDVTGNTSIPNLITTTPGNGNYSISNVGNIDGIAGDDSVSGEFVTHLTTTLLSSSAGEGINSEGWFSGINDILVNGLTSNTLFNATGGDFDLNFGALRAEGPDSDGTAVPEPATALLLGLGAVCGALKKRKSS